MDDIRLYFVQDVQYLPHLRRVDWGRLNMEWKSKVENETRAKVCLTQSVEHQPHGSDKALGPWQDLRPKMSMDDFWDNYLPCGDDGEDDDFEDWYDDGRGDNDYKNWTGGYSS